MVDVLDSDASLAVEYVTEVLDRIADQPSLSLARILATLPRPATMPSRAELWAFERSEAFFKRSLHLARPRFSLFGATLTKSRREFRLFEQDLPLWSDVHSNDLSICFYIEGTGDLSAAEELEIVRYCCERTVAHFGRVLERANVILTGYDIIDVVDGSGGWRVRINSIGDQVSAGVIAAAIIGAASALGTGTPPKPKDELCPPVLMSDRVISVTVYNHRGSLVRKLYKENPEAPGEAMTPAGECSDLSVPGKVTPASGQAEVYAKLGSYYARLPIGPVRIQDRRGRRSPEFQLETPYQFRGHLRAGDPGRPDLLIVTWADMLQEAQDYSTIRIKEDEG